MYLGKTCDHKFTPTPYQLFLYLNFIEQDLPYPKFTRFIIQIDDKTIIIDTFYIKYPNNGYNIDSVDISNINNKFILNLSLSYKTSTLISPLQY